MGEGDGAIWGICATILTATWFELTDHFKDLRSIPDSVLTCRNMTPMDLDAAEWSRVQIVNMYSDSEFFTVAASANIFFLHAVCTVHWTGCSACSTSISAFHEKCSLWLCQCYFSSQNDRLGTQQWPKEILLMSCHYHYAPHWYKHRGWLGIKTVSFC